MSLKWPPIHPSAKLIACLIHLVFSLSKKYFPAEPYLPWMHKNDHGKFVCCCFFCCGGGYRAGFPISICFPIPVLFCMIFPSLIFLRGGGFNSRRGHLKQFWKPRLKRHFFCAKKPRFESNHTFPVKFLTTLPNPLAWRCWDHTEIFFSTAC